jgi:L-amino acid N-acyltransferase YncA
MENGSSIRLAQDDDLTRIRDIFNVYVRESFAAYPEHEVDLDFFQVLHRDGWSYPIYVVDCFGDIAGFGMIRSYLPFPSFRTTVQVSYFIHPGYTRKGLGTLLLERLIRHACAQGVHTLLANISSRNEPSIQFHTKHGFVECGRLKGIGEKFGERFDVVWMQKEV